MHRRAMAEGVSGGRRASLTMKCTVCGVRVVAAEGHDGRYDASRR